MDKDYYVQYYEIERKHWWFQVRNKIIIDHIKSLLNGKKEINILNVGVATGYSTELLSELGSVVSVEYDKDCYEFVKERMDINIVNASILSLPFENNRFDLVCAFDVIEHVEDDFLAVSEMKRVCKEDGIICVTVPAFMFLWSKHDEINHHIRRYTQKQLYKVFKRPENVLFSSYFNSILFIPISMMRLFSNIFAKFKTKEKKTSDFSALNHKLLDKIFYGIFSMERPILSLRKRLPFGVSIILSYKNNDLSSAPNLPHKIR